MDNECSGKPKNVWWEAVAGAISPTQIAIGRKAKCVRKNNQPTHGITQFYEWQTESRKITWWMLFVCHEKKWSSNCDGWRKMFLKPKAEKMVAFNWRRRSFNTRPRRFGNNNMLCVWSDQSGIMYWNFWSQAKPLIYKAIANICLNQALIEKWPEWNKKHNKVTITSSNYSARVCKAAIQYFWKSCKMPRRMIYRKS